MRCAACAGDLGSHGGVEAVHVLFNVEHGFEVGPEGGVELGFAGAVVEADGGGWMAGGSGDPAFVSTIEHERSECE